MFGNKGDITMWIEIIKTNLHKIPIGTIHSMCERKANAMIEAGHAIKASKPKAEKKVDKPEKVVEVAMLKPKAETADNPPVMEKKDEKPFFARKPKKD